MFGSRVPEEFTKWLDLIDADSPIRLWAPGQINEQDALKLAQEARKEIERGHLIEHRLYLKDKIQCFKNFEYLSFEKKPNNKTHISKLVLQLKEGQIQTIKNLNIKAIELSAERKNSLTISNCWIGKISVSSGQHVNLILENCIVGKIILVEGSLNNFTMHGGALLSIECPPPYKENPFSGYVSIGKDVILPTMDGGYKGQDSSPQNWTNVRSHLMALDNIEAAGRFHSVEQRLELPFLPKTTRFFNICYGFFSDYGNSIGRPLIGIAWLTLMSLCTFYYWFPKSLHLGTETHLDANAGKFWQCLWISIEPILNPFEILNDKEYFEPSSLYFVAFHSFHRMMIILMMFFLFLALRRKFRITA